MSRDPHVPQVTSQSTMASPGQNMVGHESARRLVPRDAVSVPSEQPIDDPWAPGVAHVAMRQAKRARGRRRRHAPSPAPLRPRRCRSSLPCTPRKRTDSPVARPRTFAWAHARGLMLGAHSQRSERGRTFGRRFRARNHELMPVLLHPSRPGPSAGRCLRDQQLQCCT